MATHRSSSQESTRTTSSASSSLDRRFDSSAQLILIRDESTDSEEDTPTHVPGDGGDDEDYDDEFEDELFPSIDHLRSSPIPDLPPTLVFLYMLAPCLKLGALLVSNVDYPLQWAIPMLAFFAVLSAFARHLWYMLARYVRKANMEDIVLDTFARDRRKERRREIIRTIVRCTTGVTRICTMLLYYRVTVQVLSPQLPEKVWILPTGPVLSTILAVVLLPLSMAPSLASRRVVFSTTASLLAFVGWIVCVAYAYATGTLPHPAVVPNLGSLWESPTIFALAFTTSWTLPLYTALKRTPSVTITGGSKTWRSFRLLSIFSIALAVALILPLLFFGPSAPPASDPQPLLAFLAAATLFLGIPAVFVTTPLFPIPLTLRKNTNIPFAKIVLYLVVVSSAFFPNSLVSVVSDVLMVFALSNAYFAPAFIHIVTHTFKRPIAIVMPRTPLRSASHPSFSAQGDEMMEELLRRKERSLQKRRLLRRIAWDVGVWVLLLPVGGGGYVWAVGRLAGKW
ncbi:hypothetical protein PUNSTDRAFT_118328 [Punctularia strigosozonata HHB-11173 SS5]|uniref:uncharacterized protein n=1 Tax=Punctularia strigosozonata (strain HHB-11173) TaxID=741275 RepID=UPI0004416AE0|nr:uncharacterized protein PUNSTDRAFT_118328 [Punctularia strigosozonata HHB-11173 SS5]EIN12529.1 hypothetical protein PUNSTDRAFT_118328 [Punctularia strigosozonata HHB-11173 SS5]